MSSVPTQGSWLVLHYLAAHGAPNTAQPSHDELGLSGLMDAAKRCWTFRGYADHFAQAKIDVPLDKNPWREVCGLAGSIGESLMLAAASEIEVEWHRRALANGDLPAQMSLGRRFFSESEAQTVLSIGHRLVNLVARALMCDPDLQSAIAPRLKKWSDALTPFSDDREAWLHLNGTNVGTLRAAISGSPHKSVRSLVEPLRVLTQTPAWQQLHAQRDEDFHRWRKESAHLAGVDKSSGHLRDVLGYDGRVIGKAFGAERAPYTAADGREDDLAKVTREALDLVGGTVEKVVTALEGALEPLSKGQIIGRDEYSKQGGGEMVFHQNEFSVYLMRPLMWDAADCSCCRH